MIIIILTFLYQLFVSLKALPRLDQDQSVTRLAELYVLIDFSR